MLTDDTFLARIRRRPVDPRRRDLSPLPSMLVNHRLDIIAWNPEMAALMVDFCTLPDKQRNTLWLCMLYPPLYDFYRDRERVVRERIANLRAAWAAHPEDTALGELVEELTSHSTEFSRLWAKRCVRVNGRGSLRCCTFGSGR
jgi:hypothetical protein